MELGEDHKRSGGLSDSERRWRVSPKPKFLKDYVLENLRGEGRGWCDPSDVAGGLALFEFGIADTEQSC